MTILPDTKKVFAELGFTNPGLIERNGWQEQSLANLLRRVVRNLGGHHFICFIDALDECPEDLVRSMVSLFQDIGHGAVGKGDRLNICFSSRHYPNISIKKGLHIRIDGQRGHMADIQHYVDTTLMIDSLHYGEDIKTQILEKASRVFLWVALVVPMLNKDFDSGNIMALDKRLNELPSELSTLFRDMLVRDSEDNKAMLLCIQFVLFARRPLNFKTLYHAIQAGLGDSISECSLIIDEMMRHYILHSSKGLIEEVSDGVMRFIHESLRDFFLHSNHELQSVVQGIWPDLKAEFIDEDFEANFIGKGQDAIKEACLAEIMFRTRDDDLMANVGIGGRYVGDKLAQFYPFLDYAITYVLFHSNEAQSYGVQQADWIDQFPVSAWVRFLKVSPSGWFQYDTNVKIIYILADHGLIHLVKQSAHRLDYTTLGGQRSYGPPLVVALGNGHDQVARYLGFQVFLDQGLNIRIDEEEEAFFSQIEHQFPLPKYYELDLDKQSLFISLAQIGCAVTMRALALQGEDINQSDKRGQTPLMHTIINLSYKATRWLLSCENIDTNTVDKQSRTALMHLFLNPGRDDEVAVGICRLLCGNTGSSIVNVRDIDGRTALSYATRHRRPEITRMLLNIGADPKSRDNKGRTPLFYAVSHGHPEITRILLEIVADPNSRDNEGRTPLFYTVKEERPEIIRMLLSIGANPNSKDDLGRTALSRGVEWENIEIVQELLACPSVDPDARDNLGRSPLRWAATRILGTRGRLVLRILLKTGKVNASMEADDGLTPLDEAKEGLKYAKRFKMAVLIDDIEEVIKAMER